MDFFFGRMDVAAEYGVDVAIFLENIRYWSEKNAAVQKGFHEGRYWIHYTLEGFARLYPIWSRDQVKRIVMKCRDAGLLETADFNDDAYKRTKCYALSDKALALYEIQVLEDGTWRNRPVDVAESPCRRGEIAPGRGEIATGRGEIAPCKVLDKKREETDTKEPPCSPPKGDRRAGRRKSKEPKDAPDWKPDRFEAFWKAYPCGKSRQDAMRAWDKLRPDDELLVTMAKGLKRAMASEDWRRGIGIPYAATWLNNRKWTDEDRPPPGAGREAPPPAAPAPRRSHVEVVNGEEMVIYDE